MTLDILLMSQVPVGARHISEAVPTSSGKILEASSKCYTGSTNTLIIPSFHFSFLLLT